MGELKPCPKCNLTNIDIKPVKCLFDIRYKVKCNNCMFEIDAFETKREAREVWNNLLTRIERSDA